MRFCLGKVLACKEIGRLPSLMIGKSRTKMLRTLLGIVFALFACLASAGTLTVTSPTTGSYIGTSNSLSFNITGAVVQVTVTVTVTYPNAATSTYSQEFTPDNQGDVAGSMDLDFTESDPQGVYKINVAATEPNNTYAPTNLSVTLLPEPPVFTAYSPGTGGFVNGTVHIRATIQDSYLQQWRVQVNGQDIANNTGTTNMVAVDWDTSGIKSDGAQTVTITATDLANNTATQTIALTLIRIPPVVTVQYPTSGTTLVPGSDISILLTIQTEFSGAVDKQGVTVLAETTNGSFLAMASVISFTPGTTGTWSGRIRYQPGLLRGQFKLVVTCQDKAGNVAAPQTVNLTLSQ